LEGGAELLGVASIKVHTPPMAFRSWRDRVWLGLAIFIGVAVALMIGPAYIDPLPVWLKALIAVACGLTIASLVVYSRRRARRV